MQLKTKYFGEISCKEQDILEFSKGLYGFEKEKKFVLLPFEDSDGSLLCFQSATTPALAFVSMNPFFIMPEYKPVLQPGELKDMGVSCSEDLCYYVLCALKKPVSTSTVNFKCPIVINDSTHRAMQVILDTNEYGMRHRLSELRREEGGRVC